MTLNDFKALEGDRQHGVNSLPVTLGPDVAARLACTVMGLAQALGVRTADAALLGVAEGTAAVALTRLSYLADGRAVEFTRSVYRGDACDFVAELTMAPAETGAPSDTMRE